MSSMNIESGRFRYREDVLHVDSIKYATGIHHWVIWTSEQNEHGPRIVLEDEQMAELIQFILDKA